MFHSPLTTHSSASPNKNPKKKPTGVISTPPSLSLKTLWEREYGSAVCQQAGAVCVWPSLGRGEGESRLSSACLSHRNPVSLTLPHAHVDTHSRRRAHAEFERDAAAEREGSSSLSRPRLRFSFASQPSFFIYTPTQPTHSRERENRLPPTRWPLCQVFSSQVWWC